MASCQGLWELGIMASAGHHIGCPWFKEWCATQNQWNIFILKKPFPVLQAAYAMYSSHNSTPLYLGESCIVINETYFWVDTYGIAVQVT